MRFRQIILLLAAVLLSAVTVTLLITLVTLAQIEEAWNIIVVSEGFALTRTTLVLCLAHAIVLGLPLVFALRAKDRLGIVWCALAGFLVGALPFGIMALTSMYGVESASTGGTPTVVDHVPTLAGWIEYAYNVGFIGLFGLAGGITFWAAARLSGLNVPRSNETPPAESRVRSAGMVSLAVVLTAAIFVLPVVIRDNSCHNLFRDGRRSIGPQIAAEIKLPAEDWPTLKQMFIAFGAAHDLSFRDDQQVRRGDLMWRSLSLCSEAGVTIQAIDRPWLARINSPLAERGIALSIFELKSGSAWNAVARDLLAKMEAAWPHGVIFRGGDGKMISEEQALQGRRQ
jgi:hypothetical protein